MIGAIILAAGSSRRFGDDKRQALLPNGKTILQQSVETVLTCFDEVILVLRHDDHEFEQEVRKLIANDNLKTFLAPDSALGMGHSLANASSGLNGWDGVFVFLGDMPNLYPDTLARLKKTAANNTGAIVVPTFEGRYGHPVGFDRCYFDEIGQLEGDKGARPVVSAHPEAVIEVEVEDSGVMLDVDRPDDIPTLVS